MKVAIFHNIMWSKYKGGVFSELHTLATDYGYSFEFFQIAETEAARIGLSNVDTSYHRYPYTLLFKGAYGDTPTWQRAWAIFSHIIKSDADLIILPGYERIEFWVGLLGTVITGKKRAVFCDSTAYDRPANKFKSIFKRIFFAKCHGFFGYGKRSKQYLISLGANCKSIFHRCQAAALPKGYTKDAARSLRLAHQQSKNTKPTFLYVGRISDEKDLPTLIKSGALLKEEGLDFEIRIVGSGPQTSELQSICTQLGMSQHVIFAGSKNVDQLAEEYAEATAMVLPSWSEPWGLVVNEALSAGCPVIVSHRCGCVPELVIEGKTGSSFTAGDSTALANTMRNFIQGPADSIEAINQRIDHMDNFTPQKAAEQILEGCKIILQEGKP